MRKIGFANIAQSPQDGIVPAMCHFLPKDIVVAEVGCLDGLSKAEIDQLKVDPNEAGIAAGLKDGNTVLLSHAKILPIMQKCVDQLVLENEVDIVVILCGADWSQIKSTTLVLNPGRLFPSVISALSVGRKLGVIKPSAGQLEKERKRYKQLGIDVHVTAASPFAGKERLELIREAAEEVRDAECEIVWMTCVAMDKRMKAIVEEVVDKPVILAYELLAQNLSAVIGS